MSSRVSIGGASYNLSLEDRQFVRQLQAAERTAQQRAAAIRRNLASLPIGHPDVERFRRDLQRAEQAAARASAEIRQRLGQIGPAASATSRLMSNSFVAGFGSMVAASAGLFAIINTLKGIATATQDAANAQRGLNAQFGASAAQDLGKFTDQLASATQRSRTEAKQAAAITATLARNYGFSAAEIRTVIEVSNDLAAVSGKGLADAVQRVTAALRGETESSEALGLSLQMAALKGSDALTASEKSRLEVMGNVEGAHLRLKVLLEQAAFAEGEAAKVALEGADNFAKLTAATANLNTTLGQSSNIQAIPGILAQAATSLDNLGKIGIILGEQRAREQAINDAVAARIALRAEELALLEGRKGAPEGWIGGGPEAVRINAEEVRALVEAEFAALDVMKQIQGQTPGLVQAYETQGRAVVDLATDLKALAEAEMQAAAEERTRRVGFSQNVVNRGPAGPTIKERITEAQQTADAIVKANVEQARRIGAAQATADDAAIKSAERARDERLQAAEDIRDGALEALDAERAGADAHFDALRQQYQDDRDARLKALADARDAAIETNEAAAQAAEESFDQQIHDAERARDAQTAAHEAIRDGALETIRAEQDAESARRHQEDRDRSDSLRAEDRARADARTAEGLAARTAAQTADQNAAQRQQFIEQTRDTALAAIEAEQAARQRQSDGILAALDAQQAAEQQRHAAAVANITREEQAAVAALQRRLGLLDAADKRRQDAAQGRTLREGVSDARSGLRDARASGDPDAIRRAEQQAADAREAVRSAATKRAEDAERAHIQTQITGVQAQAQARREAEDSALAAAQQRIEAEKAAEQERLTVALEALAARGEATKASADAGLATLQSATEATKAHADQQVAAVVARYAAEDRAREDTRLADDRALEDSRAQVDRVYADRTAAANATYENEIEKIRQAFTDEETGVIPALQQAKEDSDAYYDSKRQGIDDTYQTETEQVAALYDGPTGLLRQLETAKKNSDAYFDAKRTGIDTTYEDEIALTKELYDGDTGLIQKLKDTKKAHDEWSETAITGWEEWGKAANKSLDEANPKLVTFLELLEKLKGLGASVISVQGIAAGQDDASIPAPSGGGGGGAAFATVVRNPKPYSYTTDSGTHSPYPAADIFADVGEPIYAPVGGSFNPFSDNVGGNAGILSGDDRFWYYFAHAFQPMGPAGRVEQGQQIGGVGKTGNARGTEPHLHFAKSNANDFGARGGSGSEYSLEQYYNGTGSVSEAPGGGIEVTIFGTTYTITSGDAGLDALPEGDIADYILAAAQRAGFVKPSAAIEVAMTEGGVSEWAKPGDFNTNGVPSSFGPFQMHYGGLGEPHSAGGLGDSFTQATGLNARRVDDAPEAIDYAMKVARQGGWGPWHGWTGDPWYGITHMAHGGVIPEPSYISSLATGKPYAIAGEAGPEIVAPMHGAGGGRGDIHVAVSIGNRAIEDFTVNVMDRAQRDGRFRVVPRA